MKTDWPFCSGNIVKSPKGDLYVVFGGYFDKPVLIPFKHSNSTTHPPQEDTYREVEVEDEETGEISIERHLMMDSIHKYRLVARTMHDFLVKRLVGKLYDDS